MRKEGPSGIEKSANDEMTLASSLFLGKLKAGQGISTNPPFDKQDSAALAPEPRLTGVWEWGGKDSGRASRGFLVLDAVSGTNEVVGYSIVTSDFGAVPGSNQIAGSMQLFNISGRLTRLPNGSTGLEFTRRNGKTTLTTTAQLAPGGAELLGKTTVTIDESGKPRTVSYRWQGHRQE